MVRINPSSLINSFPGRNEKELVWLIVGENFFKIQ